MVAFYVNATSLLIKNSNQIVGIADWIRSSSSYPTFVQMNYPHLPLCKFLYYWGKTFQRFSLNFLILQLGLIWALSYAFRLVVLSALWHRGFILLGINMRWSKERMKWSIYLFYICTFSVLLEQKTLMMMYLWMYHFYYLV